MFKANIYTERREQLREKIKSGLILFLGNQESSMNYPGNTYPFRQDSSFLYFFGLDSPGLAGLIDVDENRSVLYGNDVDVEEVVWMGDQPLLKDRARQVGVKETYPLDKLEKILRQAIRKGRRIHFLPPYRPENCLKIEKLLGISSSLVPDYASEELIKAVVAQRLIKSKEEIEEIEKAHSLTYEMHTQAMKMAKAGVYEREIVGQMEGLVFSAGCLTAFPTILTINGQILHNHYHGNVLQKGRMVVNDSGAESSMHYAADITRTCPVDGKFSSPQKEVYKIVLNAQKTAIELMKPGIKFKDVHLKAAHTIASGLKELGLIKGNVDDAVKAGAHALFFPHGLGHPMGLDVHDMEDLGEKYVGYDETVKKSQQFGLAALRFAKPLKSGYVLTVEPGVYFIPKLIDKWKEDKKNTQFIDYQKVEKYRDFGGIRIEDDVLVTNEGARVLGKPIPKEVEEVEEITATE
ncbi:aminopeptidase P family protein [bacterium]|nr:aminopeptidase P family protein [bacterium]